MRDKEVHLSGKEVFGLAARVFGAAEMPVGCVGAAAESVDFVEYFSENGLALLDRSKDSLVGKKWTPPRILAETSAGGICDAAGESLLFAGPPIADWAAAMALAEGASAIVLFNADHMDFLASVVWRVAIRGLSSVAVWSGRRSSRCVVGVSDRRKWVIAEFSLAASPDLVRPISQLLEADDLATSMAHLEATRETVLQWLLSGADHADLPWRPESGGCRADLSFIAAAQSTKSLLLEATASSFAKLATGGGRMLDRDELARGKLQSAETVAAFA